MVYILVLTQEKHSYKRSYIGCTKDIRVRLRQHNGEIAGGAKATTAYLVKEAGKLIRYWTPLYVVTGFVDRGSALRFEKRLQHSKIKKGKNSNAVWGYHAIVDLINRGDAKGKMRWPVLTIYCW